jgi:hypothetical protein
MKRIYLDSNILIACHSLDKAEDAKKQMVDDALAVFAQLKDIQLCTHVGSNRDGEHFGFSQEDRLRHRRRGREPVGQREMTERSQNTDRRGEPAEGLWLCRIFLPCETGILKYHSGVGDVIHSVIMKNNGIADILTFDEKDDFKQIPNFTVLHPRDIRIEK